MKDRFGAFRENLFRQPFLKRLICMLIGVITMGITITLLNMTNFGVDPFGGFSYGVSRITGLSFGTVELLLNLFLFAFVIFFDTSKLGFGTVGNMVLVGYTADFTAFILRRIGIIEITEFKTRVILMLITLIIFVIAVGLYVNSGLGAAPYDVMPNIIQDLITKATGKSVPFKFIRMSIDFTFGILGFLLKGSVGIITVLMILTLGPTIEFISKKMSKILGL